MYLDITEDMQEIEIGQNLVLIISLIVNSVLVPLLVAKHKECKHIKNSGTWKDGKRIND